MSEASTTKIMQRLAGGTRLDLVAAACILLSSQAKTAGKPPAEFNPGSPYKWLAHALNGIGSESTAQVEFGVSEFVQSLDLDGPAEFIVAMRDSYEVLRIAGLASIEIVEANR